MVAVSYAAACRGINAVSGLSEPLHNTVACQGDAPLEARDVLLALFSRRDDIVPLDDALAAIEEVHFGNPYDIVVAAATEGVIVAEFGPRTRDSSLHPIVLRRL